MVPTAHSPENQALGNKCLVQAGWAGAGWESRVVASRGRFACLGQRGAGFAWQNCSQATCASSLLPWDRDFLLFSPEKQAQESVQTYQEGNLVCGEAGVLQESTGPSEGMLQSEDTAHDKMPEN